MLDISPLRRALVIFLDELLLVGDALSRSNLHNILNCNECKLHRNPALLCFAVSIVLCRLSARSLIYAH